MKVRVMATHSLTILVSLFLGISFSQAAETVSQKKISETKRLIPLQKLTVGPDDQYNADRSPDGEVLIFTHKADLVASLHVQNLATGDVTPLLPGDADSQEPSVAEDGRIAFTYFKYNAAGDICYLNSVAPPRETSEISARTEAEIKCLKRGAGQESRQRSNPFWRSRDEIGYLERDFMGRVSNIVVENLSQHSRQILASGPLWSPSMRSGGRILTYIELSTEGARRLVVKDLSNGQTRALSFALPGISGFPQIDNEGKYLYFSHFFNDTNGDQQIDGNDNAVVFRVRIEEALKATGEIFPEQLTSVETSCSFPRPWRERILLTCAFEGSLDIYDSAASGIVPTDWNIAKIENALETSRSYQDHILLLNTLKYRAPGLKTEVEEKILGDHFQAGDSRAARFYLERRLAVKKESSYLVLNEYLRASELMKKQVPGEVSAEFRRAIMNMDADVLKIRESTALSPIVRGHLMMMIDQPGEAEKYFRLASVSIKNRQRPISLVLYFSLAEELSQRKSKDRAGFLFDPYLRMMKAPELSEQSHVYYSVEFLKTLHAENKDRVFRVKWIEKALQAKLSSAVEAVMKSELRSLELIAIGPADSKDFGIVKRKTTAYAALDKILSETRDRYFVRRATYLRAIVNFNEAAEFQFLSFVVTNWLRYTKGDDTEFAYAREVYSNSTYEQAYNVFSKNGWQLAENYFSEAIVLTDDLEAHVGYIQSRLKRNLRAELTEDYQQLTKRGFVGENIKFVDAYLSIIDAESKSGSDAGVLDQAILKLESMTEGRDAPVRHLLLGWCRLEKVLRTTDGLAIDGRLFQAAHRDLMLAYDLGRENPRIRASALMDLAILHQRAQNHGTAVRYFGLRKTYGFLNEKDRASFEYLYAASLAYARRTEKAADELKTVAPEMRSLPIEEREAFHLAMSGRHKEAIAIYTRILDEKKIVDSENLAKAHLVRGFALLKLKNFKEAQLALESAARLASEFKPRKRLREELIDFEPKRVELVALGLLSQVGPEPSRLGALKRRLEVLDQSKKIVDDVEKLKIQALVQKAEVESRLGQHSEASRSLAQAVKLAFSYGENQQFLGQVTYQSAISALAHGVLHPEAHRGDDFKSLEKLVGANQKAYREMKTTSPILDAQDLKLEIFLARFRSRVLGEAVTTVDLSSPTAKRLSESSPELFAEVTALKSALSK